MRKPPLQDIIVKERDVTPRSTRPSRPLDEGGGIVPPSQHTTGGPVRDVPPGATPPENMRPQHRNPLHEYDPSMRKRRLRGSGRRWFGIAVGIGFVIVLSSVALSLLFAGATVVVHPKEDTMVVNAIFTVSTDATTSQGVLSVERMSLKQEAKETVVALGEEEVEERASGKVTIYNEYSETPQRIIPRTRFKSSDGLVYRVSEAVEIPGMKSDGTPGTIEITIRAEEPGEQHNIGPDTFTLPGYEEAGLPQAEKIYAKSTEGMTGGFKGIRRSVSEEERKKTIEKLEATLRDELLAAAFSSTDTPDNFYLFKDAVFFSFEPIEDELVGEDKVSIGVEGTLHGILFPKQPLAKRIAELTLGSYDGSSLRIDNIDELSFSVTPEETEGQTGMAPWTVNTYKVVTQGKAHFIWEFDETALAKDFSGKSKDVLNAPLETGVLGAYPGIDTIEISIRPFWKNSFPDSPEDITVVTELDD